MSSKQITQGEDKPLNENDVINHYRELQKECNSLAAKVSEIEVDRNEHRLVEETLKPMEPKRRAYRLVGGVLVERSVGEVLPSVSSNLSNLEKVLKQLEERLELKGKQTAEWKAKYNIKTAEEAEALRKQQQQ